MSRKTYEKLAHINGMFNVLEQQIDTQQRYGAF